MKTRTSEKVRRSRLPSNSKPAPMPKNVKAPPIPPVPAERELSVTAAIFEGKGNDPVVLKPGAKVHVLPGPVRDVDPQEEKRLQEEQEREREQAFRASGHAWKGVKVWPLAIDREGDLYMHRAVLGLLPLHEVVGSGQSFLLDAVRLVWFCAHEPDEWLRAPYGEHERGVWRSFTPLERTLRLEVRIREWATEHVGPGDQKEIVRLALALYDQAYDTQVVPNGGGGGSEGNAPGQ